MYQMYLKILHKKKAGEQILCSATGIPQQKAPRLEKIGTYLTISLQQS